MLGVLLYHLPLILQLLFPTELELEVHGQAKLISYMRTRDQNPGTDSYEYLLATEPSSQPLYFTLKLQCYDSVPLLSISN